MFIIFLPLAPEALFSSLRASRRIQDKEGVDRLARKPTPKGGPVEVYLGRPNSDKQEQFFDSRTKYTCYGGARGGGKSWCTQRKVVGGCLKYEGLRVLVVRRRYEDLENSVIEPILNLV